MTIFNAKALIFFSVLVVLAAPQDARPAQTSSQAAAPSTAVTPPANQGILQPKTQAEYDAYQAIRAKPQTPEEFEKAADDFAAKFPDSNLRILLYRGVMQSFQKSGDSDKMIAAGLKVLALDKDDPEALIVVAEIQEEHTTAMDLDREPRMDQSLANAQHALQTIDTDLTIPAGTPAERVDAYKKYLRSTALAIVGKIQYKRQLYADAEATLRKALDADAANPDPVVLLSLALSLDMQKKYQDALVQANHAVDLTKEDTDVGKSARFERDRLAGQIGPSAGVASPSFSVAPPQNGAQGGAPQTATPQNSAQPSH